MFTFGDNLYGNVVKTDHLVGRNYMTI